MTIPNPEHLLEQAGKLARSPIAGVARQVDLRRAISAAYYGVFHFTLTSLADEFVGVPQRSGRRYALVYRSLDHKTFREICVEVRKSTQSRRFAPYLPPGGFGPEIRSFSADASELQEMRNSADYDPSPRFRSLDAHFAIDTARDALGRFKQAAQDERRLFLTLLLCPPR